MQDFEIKSARTYNQKVFDIGTDKKRFRIHAGHIHYKDKAGNLQDSDLAIKRRLDGSWAMSRHNYHFTFPKHADGLFDFHNVFEGANHHIKLKPVAAHVRGVKEENAILYRDAFGKGLDYKAQIQRSGARKIIIINENPGKDLTFDFELILDGKTQWLKKDLSGQEGFVIGEEETDLTGKPFRFGADDKYSFVKQAIVWDSGKIPKQENIKLSLFRKKGKTYLRKSIPKSFFDAAVFPVFTDHPTDYYSSTSDGRITGEHANWTTCRGLTSGTVQDASAAVSDYAITAMLYSGKYYIMRTFFFFDTSGIPDGYTVDSCDLKVYGYSQYDSDVSAQKGAQSDPLVGADFNNFEGSEYGHVSWAANQYNTIGFNAQGKSDINKTGTTKICCREYTHDYLDSSSGCTGALFLNGCYFAEQSGTDKDPYLDIVASSGLTAYSADGRGKNNLYNTFSPLCSPGKSAITITYADSIGRGRHLVVFGRYSSSFMRGKRKIYNAFPGHRGRGRFSSMITIFGGSGGGAFTLLAQFANTGRGLKKIYNTFDPLNVRGQYVIQLPTYSAYGRGRYYIGWNPYRAEGQGRCKFYVYCEERGRGFNRIADSALAQYELYRGVDSAPDFEADPWETFASLPHESAALDPSHSYHFVLRERNAWDLVSQNIAEWVITIDASGNEVVIPPSAPQEITAITDTGGTVRVAANYYHIEDGDNRADKFLVYLTSDGSDPDPDADTPTEITMSRTGGVCRLNWQSSAYADGTIIKVIARTRRVDSGPVNVDSTNTDIYSAEADTDGPAQPQPAGIFFGKIYEQRQGS